MPIAKLYSDIPEETHKLFKMAVDRTRLDMLCRCCSLRSTVNLIEANFPSIRSIGVPGVGRIIDITSIEPIVDAFINYRVKPLHFRQLESSTILGHTLILRALGSEAANRIGQAYIDMDGHAKELCVAFLLWVGDHPELSAVEEKITLDAHIASGLLREACNRLTNRIQVSNRAYEYRQRLSAEMLSNCEIPERLQLALDQDRRAIGGTLTYQTLLSELEYISAHVDDVDLKHRIVSLILSLIAKMDER